MGPLNLSPVSCIIFLKMSMTYYGASLQILRCNGDRKKFMTNKFTAVLIVIMLVQNDSINSYYARSFSLHHSTCIAWINQINKDQQSIETNNQRFLNDVTRCNGKER